MVGILHPGILRRLAVGAVLLAVVGVPSLAAVAQTTDEIVDALELRGYYVEDGLDVPIDAMESLVDRYPEIGFVALDGTPSAGADGMADRLLDLATSRDTIVVLTADEAGAASAVHPDAVLDGAFDAAFDGSGDTYERDFQQVAEALAGSPTGTTRAEEGSRGGFGLGWLLVIAVVVGVSWLAAGTARRDKAAFGRRLADSRAEIQDQMARLANAILAFSDRVDADTSPEAVTHFRTATATYEEAERRLATAANGVELERLADDLDEARWELAAAEAVLEGREVPPRPEDDHPKPCFFDPTHGAGVEVAELQTPAGTKRVLVCRADAEKLRRGERPEPRTIDVAGRSVPAPQAPRSAGGGGLDWLEGFSILVGGMGDALPYRWGRPRRRRGGFPGGFGGPIRRSSGWASRTRGSVSRSRSGGSRSVGRSRRGR